MLPRSGSQSWVPDCPLPEDPAPTLWTTPRPPAGGGDKDHQHLVHLEEDCADPDRNDQDQRNYHCLYADRDNSGQDVMEGLSPS